MSTNNWFFISDLHFYERFLQNLKVTTTWLVQEAEKVKAKHIFILGDSLHTRSDVNLETLSELGKFFNALLKISSKPHLHILVGNHDMRMKHSRALTSLDAFDMANSGINNSMTIYREITQVKIDNQNVLFIPYHEDQNEIINYINDFYKNNDAKVVQETIVMGHMAINGSKCNGFSDHSNREYKTGFITMSLLLPFKRVFSGHFHHHQSYMNNKIVYIGAPYQQNFGDINDEKRGCVLFNAATNTHELICNPYAVNFIRELYSNLAALPEKPTIQDKEMAARLKGKFVQCVIFQSVLKQKRNEYEDVKRKLIMNWAIAGVGKPLQVPDQNFSETGSSINSETLSTISEESNDNEAKKQSCEFDEKALDQLPQGAVAMADVAHDVIEPLEDANSTNFKSLAKGYLKDLGQKTITPSNPVIDNINTERQNQLYDLFKNVIEQVYKEKGLQGNFEHDDIKDTTHNHRPDFFRGEIQSVSMQNFLGVREKIVIDFSKLDSGIWIITGRNGAGKSTIPEAICWCLFGKTLRKKLAVGDIVNRDAPRKESCVVEIVFANGYKISRTRRNEGDKNKLIEVKIIDPFGNSLQRGTKNDTEAEIVKLIMVDYDTFVRTVVVSAEDTTTFMNSKAEDKRTIIENLLGFEQFSWMYDIFKTNQQKGNKELQAIDVQHKIALEAQKQIAQRKQDTINEIKRYEANSIAVKTTLDKLKQKYETVTDSWEEEVLKQEQQKIEEKKQQEIAAKIVELTQKLHQAEEKLAEELLQQDNTTVAEAKVKLEIVNNDLIMKQNIRTKFENIKTLRKQAQTQQQSWQDLKEKNKFYITIQQSIDTQLNIAYHCNDGLREQLFEDSIKPLQELIQDKSVESIKQQIQTMQSNYNQTMELVKQAEEGNKKSQFMDLNNLNVEIQNLEIEKQNLQKVLETRINIIEAVKKDKNVIDRKKQIQIWQAKVKPAPRLDATTTSTKEEFLEKLEQQKLGIGQEIIEWNTLIMRNNNELERLRDKLSKIAQEDEKENKEKLESILNSINEQQHQLQNLAFWADALNPNTTKQKDKFRCYCLSKDIDAINVLLAHNLELLNADPNGIQIHDINCQLTDNLEIVQVDTGMKINNRSSGQRKRTDLAVFFTFFMVAQRRSKFQTSMMILDEVFDSLDEAGTLAVQRWAQYVLDPVLAIRRDNKLKHIFIITHSPYITSEAKGHILAKRNLENTQSYYEIVGGVTHTNATNATNITNATKPIKKRKER